MLKEDSKELAKIKNVSFNSLLNLNENNTNIEILDERIEFLGGMLNVVINKENYTFEGFFTYQNGVGNRYIDANGDAINYWKETGYEFDIKTNSYILQDNVYIDPETNQIVIPIYIYWSYLKTRINFEMIPSISTNYTAQDIVSGVDWYNSWYYSTSPNYIEVSFNTDIRITAPEVEGYAFFKYVISQKNSSGVWLTDVVAYTEQIPWSTNEYDRIVECRIKIIYFAQVEVKIFGGEGGFEIVQDYTETQAKSMLENGYVDTTKPYALEAKPSEGYQFVRWTNSSTGKHTYSTKIENLTTTKKANFLLTLKGIKATLSFEEYDATFGQITQLIIVSKDNNYQTLTLGTFVGDDFNKILKTVDVAVGDKITLIIKINYGFAVVWNRNDITFDSYSGNNVYRFNMNIMPADAGQTIVINPTFEDEILSIYATTKFEDSQIREDALDLNVVNKAGYFQYNGQKTTFFTIANGNDIIVDIVCMARYQIANVILENYENVFVNNNEIYKQNQIILTKEFMQANNIIGNINIIVEFKRAMWIEQTIVEEFEGDGTKGRPYQISSADQLAKIMNLINTGVKNNEGKLYADCAYQLTADIDLSQYFWTPIGNDDYAFNGSFDFANHNVYGINLAYTCDKINYNGLFSNVGINGKIFSSNANYWYIYLVVVLFIFMLAILFVLLFVHKKHRKEREKLANK